MSNESFRISPLIQISLWLFYVTLTLPLPFLAWQQGQNAMGWVAVVGIGVGAIALFAALCERVCLDENGIAIAYPQWVPQWYRASWSLAWSEITDIRARSTGQGGLVYYLIHPSEGAYLLPMRVAGFARMTQRIQAQTGLDLEMTKPLAQIWMYGLLLGVSLLLGLFDGWVIWMVVRSS